MPRGGDRGHGGRGGGRPSDPRPVQISKALSRLLRHSAAQEGIPIDNSGWVRCDRVLNWGRLRSMTPKVEMGEVVEGVSSNEKGRFGLMYRGKGRGGGVPANVGGKVEVNGELKDKDKEAVAEDVTDEAAIAEINGEQAISEEKVQSDTQRAIAIFESGEDTAPSHFFIRANQGHSMKGVEAENLLTPITLDDEASIPETVAHGTFYGAWERILKDGALKTMNRNHVHFSSGPSLKDVLSNLEQGDANGHTKGASTKGRLGKMMAESKVVSGMRADAQILIFIAIGKALKEGGMKWWRSENGVILTEGDGGGMVGKKYWSKVIEAKEGLGVLWEDGEVKQELPSYLKGQALPFGKSRSGGLRGGRRGGRENGADGRPSLKVEKHDAEM